jgi:hypothetical protein
MCPPTDELWGLGHRESLRALLMRGGFENVRITAAAMVCRFPSPVELLRQEMQTTPLAEPIGELDPPARDALVADLEATLDPYVDDGGLAMTMESHIAVASASPSAAAGASAPGPE